MRAAVALVLLAIGAAGGAAALAACSEPAPAAPRTSSGPRFDSARAFEHVRQLVSIGPRASGTPGGAEARRYLLDQARVLGLAATEQPFVAATPFGPVAMANVIVTLPGASPERIVIGGHFDTKLFREFRFVGANDGGSSTAVVLELARALKGRRNPYTFEFVFFDGEEALLRDWSGKDNTYGSRHYVEQARGAGSLTTLRAMLLVDMVGDRDLTLRRESRSTRWLTDALWASAKRLGYAQHFLDESEAIEDDHVAFLQAGIPAVDLIDLQYDAWHTADDTLDKVSARSLQVVGDVVLDALPAIEKTLAAKNRG